MKTVRVRDMNDRAKPVRAKASTGREAEPSLDRRIAGELEKNILSGEWPPGHRIPFEVDLATHYGCSRMTVNKVLTRLAARGLIERRRKAGSFVSRPQGQSAVMHIGDIRTEALGLGKPYRYELLSSAHRKATAEDRERLDLKGAGAVLALECRHFSGDLAFCLEKRLINLAAVPAAEEADFSAEAPGPWLLGRVPWSDAEHRIRAEAADAALAKALDLNTGAPCLVMERRTHLAGRTVTFVRFTYPGHLHSLVASFRPSESV